MKTPMSKPKREALLTTLLCLLPILAGAALYDRLPERIATHFGLDGEADGWSGRAFAAFGLPALMAGINLLMHFGLSADPKRENMSPALRTIAVWSMPLLTLLLSWITLGKALGYAIPVERILPMLVGALFVAVGNYLPKTKQSYTMGIKLPWTLASEENWNRTHRFAGFLWVLVGALTILLTLLRLWRGWLFLALFAALAVVPAVYSYLLYKKGL